MWKFVGDFFFEHERYRNEQKQRYQEYAAGQYSHSLGAKPQKKNKRKWTNFQSFVEQIASYIFVRSFLHKSNPNRLALINISPRLGINRFVTWKAHNEITQLITNETLILPN